MEAQSVCQLIPIKKEIFEPPSDINLEVIKKEPINDIDEDDFDESELTIQKPPRIYWKISSATDHQLFPIENDLMEPAQLDPLYINPELIKSEPIDDDSFSMGSYGSFALPIDTITSQPNAYMTEKSKSAKKKTSNNVKQGKDNSSQAISNRMQRKDKGTSRLTSFMLWAKEKRQQLLSTHPELDFSSISRELGKIWANVPSNVKYNLKRRANRINAKTNKAKRKSTNHRTSSLVLVDEGLQEHGMPFSKIKQETGGYNVEFNSAESTNYPMKQWTITEVAEEPDSYPKRKRKYIEDDDFFPTKKARLERDKLVNGTRPRGRPKKLFDVGKTDKRTQKKNVNSTRKSSGQIQSLKSHSPNQTSDVEPVERIKVELESEVITDDPGESTISY